MRNFIFKIVLTHGVLIGILLMSTIHAGAGAPAKKNVDTQLYERIDFGNSYILGQSIKSGAVYLLQRKKSDIDSMLKIREHYRTEILEDFTVKDLTVDKKKNIKKKK